MMATSNSIRSARIFRLSLREVLVLVALVALAIASLKFSNETFLALVAAVTMSALIAALIIAVVDRGPRQAFAIGVALTMIAYGLILVTGQRTSGNSGNVYSRNIEFDHMAGRLPTTRLLRYVHKAVQRSEWIDPNTKKVIPNYDPNNPGIPRMGGGGFFPGGGAWHREIPPREIFMPIGHCWWALILGYCGGLFGQFVYARRMREGERQV
jgi:hypothetical protein